MPWSWSVELGDGNQSNVDMQIYINFSFFMIKIKKFMIIVFMKYLITMRAKILS